MQQTTLIKPADVTRSWHIIDVSKTVLGRSATQIAKLLVGKHKLGYTPNVDNGDYVVVINASEVVVTRNKPQQKMYHTHSNYPGGLRSIKFADLQKKFPERIIEKAVFNMLPKNKLRSMRMNRLKVFAGAEHTHESQLGTKE
ncbi:MAG: 50S ribosomal protein L13 [bacterium]|nr:50S ribosomal protein L13 [bacterium]